jgi:Cd2+/Zn2+-exporting ATPase
VADREIHIEVIRPYEKSELSRILDMVQHASERKAPAELFIRKFARIYTPVVIGLAGLIVLVPWILSLFSVGFVYDFDAWLYRGLIFLVISCPCALVVSIPLGFFGGIGAASRLGILFKGGNYLDAITKVDTVVFDKTGTLTKGVFEVQEVQAVAGVAEERELVAWVAAVERHSTHPIAKAVVHYAEAQGIEGAEAAEIREIAGHGLQAKVQGEEVLVGNVKLLQKCGVAFPAGLQGVEGTMVVCAKGGEYAGYLLLADSLKEDALEAVAGLKAAGIREVEILSGDRQGIVTAFARRLGVTAAYGDLLPEGKVAHLEALKRAGRRVAFVGDGMNDAPVLALSHVGIAMGGLGSDAAIESADVVIQTDQPSKVAVAVRVGKATLRIVWQNVVLAIGVKFAVLLLGVFGVATMWEAVFADVGVALLAVLNAVRVQRIIK